MCKPLINGKFLLQKYIGNAGWIYVLLPEVLKSEGANFGWVKVKGSIDGVEFKKYSLMPYKGQLFLPVKAEIRKQINKKEGDYVHVILYSDNEPLEIPEEMLLCLKDEPEALSFFNTLNENERLAYIKWIYAPKKEETKIERLAKVINGFVRGEKFSDIIN